MTGGEGKRGLAANDGRERKRTCDDERRVVVSSGVSVFFFCEVGGKDKRWCWWGEGKGESGTGTVGASSAGGSGGERVETEHLSEDGETFCLDSRGYPIGVSLCIRIARLTDLASAPILKCIRTR